MKRSYFVNFEDFKTRDLACMFLEVNSDFDVCSPCDDEPAVMIYVDDQDEDVRRSKNWILEQFGPYRPSSIEEEIED